MKELVGVLLVDEVINERPMRWRGHIKRMDTNRMGKIAFESKLTGVKKVGRHRDGSIVWGKLWDTAVGL